MERKKASSLCPEVLELVGGSVRGMFSRRDFLDRAAKFAIGGLTVAAMLGSVDTFAQNPAKDDYRVKNDDARIKSEYLTYPSPKGSGNIRGYLARPATLPTENLGKLPCVVVIHENRGLSPYIEDVARRLAVENIVAFAPDALTPVGGYPGNEEKAAQLFGQLDAVKRSEDLLAAPSYLKSRPECTDKIGLLGFSYGGSLVLTMATLIPDLSAVVSYYGVQPSAEDTARIKAPLLIHYAALDDRIWDGWAGFEKALKANKVKQRMEVYPNVNSGFHNDTSKQYDKIEANLSWVRTLFFLKENLRSPRPKP